MRCPNCDFENSVSSTICLHCGASLEANPSPQETPSEDLQPSSSSSGYTNSSVYQAYQARYRAPAPPPTNGHNRLFPPPPPPRENNTDETDEGIYGQQSQIFDPYKGRDRQLRWTASRVMRSIMYFIWAAFGGFGVLGACIAIADSNALVAIGLLAWLGILIASIIIFIRLRHRMPRLSFPRFLLCFITTTVLAFMVIIVETAISGDSAKNLSGLFLGIIFAVYGLVIAVFALW